MPQACPRDYASPSNVIALLRLLARYVVEHQHNIWTSVLDVVQRIVFPNGLRLDDERLYVRNACGELPNEAPNSSCAERA